jgi:catechol-2,3-dioxygenase
VNAPAGSGLGPIGQIALHVSDADRAERFYRETISFSSIAPAFG